MVFDFLMCKIAVSWPIRALCCFVNLFNCLAFFWDCRVMWTNILCGSMRWTQWTLKTLAHPSQWSKTIVAFCFLSFPVIQNSLLRVPLSEEKLWIALRVKDTSGVPKTLMNLLGKEENFSFFGKYFNDSKSIVSTLRWSRRTIFCAELWKIPNNKRLKWRSFGGPPNNNHNHKGGGTKGSPRPQSPLPSPAHLPLKKKLQYHE